MNAPESTVLVLRSPASEGNFDFRLAELPRDDMERWERLIRESDRTAVERQVSQVFSEPLPLGEAISRLRTQDFRVIEMPPRMPS